MTDRITPVQNEVPEGSPAAPDAPARASRLSRFRAAILSNKLFTVALAAGAIVRLITVLGYPGLLVFQGDTYVYIGAALRLQPNLSKTTGYSLYLKALEPLHSFTLVMITQHLMGLAMALMLYALLRRARVRAWIATLATVPILFNGFEIQLEHMVMADLLFEFCMFAAATLLLWNRRPSWRNVLLAGLVTGFACTVWSGGLLLPVIFFLAVLWRRLGWRSLAAIVVGCAVPILSYAIWFHAIWGNFALTNSEGFYLYGRVSSFADCAKIDPPADLRYLCIKTPIADRAPPGSLVWHLNQVHEVPGGPVSPEGNKVLRDFALDTMKAQPLAYAHAIVKGVVLSVDWKRYDYPSAGTVYDYYFHTKPIWVPPHHTWIKGGTASQDIRAYGRQGLGRTVKPFDQLMAGYQRIFYLYGPLFGVILFIGLGSLIRVYRRNGRFRLGRWRDGPSKMPFVCALVLLLFPIMVADFDYRYVLPVVPFACLAAGLAFASPAARRGPGEDPSPEGAEADLPNRTEVTTP
jgi:hypothetical protein